MLSVPGLIVPEIAFPSHFNTTSTSSTWFWLGPQVPSHDPLSGCPSCATSDGADERARNDSAITKIHARMYVLLTGYRHRRVAGCLCCCPGRNILPLLRSSTVCS